MPNRTIAGRAWHWGRLFGGSASPTVADDAQRGYAGAALDLLARCEQLQEQWLEQLEEQRRNERLANAAAVYHWHLNAVRERLAGLEAPPALGAWHEALVDAVEAAYRGTQLLSHGYRFHNVRRICDGGLLLEEARAQAQAIRDALVALLKAEPAAPTGQEAPSD